MPYELGRALLLSEAITPAALSRALFVVATEGIPLPRVLVALGLIAPEKLDEELARADVPFVQQVVPVKNLVDALPSGLCSRLLALPIRIDPRTGTIDVAVADTRDPHGAHEIGFFLRAPIRMVRAPLATMERALDRSTAPPPAMHALAERQSREPRTWTTPVPRSAPRIPAAPRVAMIPETMESDLPPVLQTLSPSRLPRSNPAAHALLSHDGRASQLRIAGTRRPSYAPNGPPLPFPEASHHLA
ncbi:MAG TPA: hypothetical protein VNO21_18550, partial [Polyangiaceae bacterium]|nr:hypothetical protein [Polyangiaceae bacterium]